MLVNPPILPSEYRHNYVRLSVLLGTVILFSGYVVINQLAERGNNRLFPNTTLRAEEFSINDVTPSDWVYRSLDCLNYLWQFAWLLYSLTFIYRRGSTGYLYLFPDTLSPPFSALYILGFAVQAIWLLAFHQQYLVWSWVIYLISFLFLSGALFVFTNSLRNNLKLYETEGLNSDVWYLRFFIQNGVAFFACLTAIRFVLGLNTFLQYKLNVSVANAGTTTLVLAALIALLYLFGGNLPVAVFDQITTYLFSPWIVFLFFFWGVVEKNWLANNPTRNNIISAIELALTILSALVTLALFTLRYRAARVDLVV